MEAKKRSLYRHELKEALEEYNCKTVDDVLDIIFGGYDNDYWTDFVVYRKGFHPKTTMLNRFNTIWVYPLFILCVPFRYVMFGSVGFNRDSKIGKFILDLVGQ